MGQKGTGRRLSDQERMEIISKLEGDKPRASAADCARQYGVSSAAITKLMKMKDKIKQRFQENNTFSQQRKRGGTERHSAFEDELFQWISLQQQLQDQDQTSLPGTGLPSPQPLTSAKVQEKAQDLLKAHNLGSFRASKGWYYRFCRRYGLSRSSMSATDGDQQDLGGDDQGLDHSGSESDSSARPGRQENGLSGDAVAGVVDSVVATVKTDKPAESKKRKEGSSSLLSTAREGKKAAKSSARGWSGVESLQDTLARAAVALDHPEARGYLGDNAAGEMLRSIQQSIGVVQCIRLKKTASDASVSDATPSVDFNSAAFSQVVEEAVHQQHDPTPSTVTQTQDVIV